MPGSKKGERRGGAKPGHIRKSAAPAKPRNKGGRPRGSENKSKFHAEVGVILNRHKTPLQKEQELEMYFAAVGKRMRLPREVMLDAMRYFEESGIEWGQVLQANMIASAGAKTVEERAVYESAVSAAEARMQQYLAMAVDVAYKAAPYVHPRLAAMITNPTAGESPLNAIGLLFKDLDEAGRPPKYIDHDPSEVVK